MTASLVALGLELGEVPKARTVRTQQEVIIPKARHNDRRCVATGEALAPRAPAIRFVRGPDGAAVPDLAGKLPGRGAWVTPRRDLVSLAAKRGFAKAFKAETKVAGGPDAFAAELGALLEARALSGLGLARRAGALFAGFEAVSKRVGDLSAYLSPNDASADGVGKIASRLKAAGLASGMPASHILLPATAETLAQAIGEASAVHLGLMRNKPGLAAAEAAALWAGYDSPLSPPI